MNNLYHGFGRHGIYVFEYDAMRGEDREWVRRSDDPYPTAGKVYRLPMWLEYYRRVQVWDNGALVSNYQDGKET